MDEKRREGIELETVAQSSENLSNPSGVLKSSSNDNYGQEVLSEIEDPSDSNVRKYPIPKFIILHYSPFKAVWDWFILLLVLYTSVFTPFTVAFLLQDDKERMKVNLEPKSRTNQRTNAADALQYFDLFVDLAFGVDIFINFRTTFVQNGEVITDPNQIAKNYIKKWFIVDILAAVPYDFIIYGGGTTEVFVRS